MWNLSGPQSEVTEVTRDLAAIPRGSASLSINHWPLMCANVPTVNGSLTCIWHAITHFLLQLWWLQWVGALQEFVCMNTEPRLCWGGPLKAQAKAHKLCRPIKLTYINGSITGDTLPVMLPLNSNKHGGGPVVPYPPPIHRRIGSKVLAPPHLGPHVYFIQPWAVLSSRKQTTINWEQSKIFSQRGFGYYNCKVTWQSHMRKLNKTHRTFEGTQCLSVSRKAHRLPWCCCWVLNSTDGGVPHSELEQEFTHFFFFAWCLSKRGKKEKKGSCWRSLKSDWT